MPPAGFEPATPTNERPQTHALDRAATGIGSVPPLPHLTSCTPSKSNLSLANSLALINKATVGIDVVTNRWTLKTDLNDWCVGKNKTLSNKEYTA
jgi:hypothetical protein